MDAKNLAIGTGRRKTSIARVYLRQGSGKILVNGRDVDAYFGNPSFVYVVRQALEVTDGQSRFDVLINVKGGGVSGQAGACRHGIARALRRHSEANAAPLKANGFLTRDSRMVERKKYGQRKARRRFQFSKR
ncbi:MAG: 30S ribosomal protein S9 [Spirochaetales bacterium]|nr:30S ribosomal protein S9 [Spirochaetales bacterium]